MSNSGRLNESQIQEIQRLLGSGDSSGMMQAAAVAASTEATVADLAILFPESVLAEARSRADALHFGGANDISWGVSTTDAELIRQGENQLAESLRLYASLSEIVRLGFMANEHADAQLRRLLLDLVEIPAGEFNMGSPRHEPGRARDEDQKVVCITRPLLISRTVVTQQQWQDVMGSDPWNINGGLCVDEGELVDVEFDPADSGLRCGRDIPVVFVVWDLANLFCEMLTKRERAAGLLSDGQHYRLPTEAEWEYACRAQTTTAYSFGDDADGLTGYAWFDENSGEEVQPVGQLQPNPWGLFDMHGNVREWCADWYAEERIGGSNPRGPTTGARRVVRGGCYASPAESCRSASRGGWEPWLRDYDLLSIGFRVILSAAEPTA